MPKMLRIACYQPTSNLPAPPEWIRIATKAEIPTTVYFPAIPSTSDLCAKYQEASEERDPAYAGLHGAKFVAWCFSSGEDSRKHRNRDDTIEGVAIESDNSEDEDN
jgi:hypothetical protein